MDVSDLNSITAEVIAREMAKNVTEAEEVKTKEITESGSDPRLIAVYLGHHCWFCPACLTKIEYQPKGFEGPQCCPHCQVEFWGTETTLTIKPH